MKFEKEIKQTRAFRSKHERAMVNLLYTGMWVEHNIKTFLARFDITSQQYNVLRILKGQHPNAVSTKEIKLRMLDKNSDTSRLVTRLLKNNLVCQAWSRNDKRKVDVCISAKGIRLLATIKKNSLRMEKIMHTLSAVEINHLNRLLDKLRG